MYAYMAHHLKKNIFGFYKKKEDTDVILSGKKKSVNEFHWSIHYLTRYTQIEINWDTLLNM